MRRFQDAQKDADDEIRRYKEDVMRKKMQRDDERKQVKILLAVLILSCFSGASEITLSCCRCVVVIGVVKGHIVEKICLTVFR